MSTILDDGTADRSPTSFLPPRLPLDRSGRIPTAFRGEEGWMGRTACEVGPVPDGAGYGSVESTAV